MVENRCGLYSKPLPSGRGGVRIVFLAKSAALGLKLMKFIINLFIIYRFY